MISLLKKIDKKYAFGLLTGLIFGILGFYADFLRQKNPKLEFDIISNTEILDVKEDVGKIDIFYDGENLQKQNQTLRLIVLRITNNGSEHILKDYYYEDSPLGFKIENGEILEKPIVLQTSNTELKKAIKFFIDSTQTVTLPNFILEKSDYFTIKLLIKHSQGKEVILNPIGKIVGVKKIKLVNSFIEKENESFWQRLIKGSIGIHIARFFMYIFGFGFGMMAIIFPIAIITEYFSKRKREKNLKVFKLYLNKESLEKYDWVLKEYQENGDSKIGYWQRLANDKELLARNYKQVKVLIHDYPDELPYLIAKRHPDTIYRYFRLSSMAELRKKGIIKEDEDGNPSIETDFSELINTIVEFLEK
ncbi:MAG: hypothetical protein R3D58_15225 [Saprospiraceae bacterium]